MTVVPIGEAPAIIETIAAAYARTAHSRLPKHARLFDALVSDIDSGVLRAGTKLPGERELCAGVGISLGTAQKALAMLVAEGRIVREHGRGTYVRAGRRPLTELWHYRFRDPETKALLPVYAKLHSRDLVKGEPAWQESLGADPAGYVRIVRIVSIAAQLSCWSEMYLPSSRFSRLLTVPRVDLERVNLKQLLAVDFNAPTVATTQTVLVTPPPPHICQGLDIRKRDSGLLLQIVASSRHAEPISYQRIYVPPTHLEMEIGTDNVTAAAVAAA